MTVPYLSLIHISRLRLLYPLFIVWGVCLLVVAFERDLGSALLFYTIFLIMLYVATGRVSYVLIGLVLLAVGAFGMYQIMGHVQVRVAIWLDPFKDAQNLGLDVYKRQAEGYLGSRTGRARAYALGAVSGLAVTAVSWSLLGDLHVGSALEMCIRDSFCCIC